MRTSAASEHRLDRRVRLRNGRMTTHLSASWYAEFTWPSVHVRPFGFQVLADCALRIDPSAKAFGFAILGFGVAVFRFEQPNSNSTER